MLWSLNSYRHQSPKMCSGSASPAESAALLLLLLLPSKLVPFFMLAFGDWGLAAKSAKFALLPQNFNTAAAACPCARNWHPLAALAGRPHRPGQRTVSQSLFNPRTPWRLHSELRRTDWRTHKHTDRRTETSRNARGFCFRPRGEKRRRRGDFSWLF